MSAADRVRAAVGAVSDPELRRPIGELDMLRDITVEGDRATVGIVLTIVGCPAQVSIAARTERSQSATETAFESPSRFSSERHTSSGFRHTKTKAGVTSRSESQNGNVTQFRGSFHTHVGVA